jgi:tRNA pseudouridine32 synthase/23S rRNA pseudouridine746 synthase/23S rRNA pseudouridine1911/1915/1917 synthase
VVGDRRYGADSSLEDRALALHHALLRLDPPARPRRETFTAEPPEIWTEALTDEMRTALRRVRDHAQSP